MCFADIKTYFEGGKKNPIFFQNFENFHFSFKLHTKSSQNEVKIAQNQGKMHQKLDFQEMVNLVWTF